MIVVDNLMLILSAPSYMELIFCHAASINIVVCTAETIAFILFFLWALRLVSSYSMGGLIHVLLVIAIVMIMVRVILGRRV
jgi:hypothetical protein